MAEGYTDERTCCPPSNKANFLNFTTRKRLEKRRKKAHYIVSV